MQRLGWTAEGAGWVWTRDYRGFRLTVAHDPALDQWECSAANACSTLTARHRGDGLAAARQAMRLADQLADALPPTEASHANPSHRLRG